MKLIPFEESNPIGALLMSAFQPDKMAKHERQVQYFSFEKPDLGDKSRAVAVLGVTDLMAAQVQVLRGCGEGLHVHAAMTGFWMVLQGRVTFKDADGNTRTAGPLEGVVVPRGTIYGFRAEGPEDAMVLQVEALVSTAKQNTYKLYEPSDAGSAGEYAIHMDLYDARD